MGPARNLEPRMLRHARTDRAFIILRDENGRRRQVSLGAWGSPDAYRRYHLELTRWQARRRGGEAAAALADVERDANLTIADAGARWLLHCEAYYRRADGTLTTESDNCSRALAPLFALFAHEALAAFVHRSETHCALSG